jgi:hypothetical protein
MTVVDNEISMALGRDRHADDEELERYSLGDEAEEECAWVEEHLLVCAACRQRLEAHEVYVRSMGLAAAEWRADHVPVARRRWFFPRLVPLMAAALICLATAAMLWLGRNSFRNAQPAFAVTLNTTRGMAAGARAPARRPLDLKPDFTGLAAFPHYDLRVVDHLGSQVAQVEATPSAGTRIRGLAPGAFFVRIYSPAGELLREYALVVAD